MVTNREISIWFTRLFSLLSPRYVVAHHGYRELYRGLEPVFWRNGLSNAFFFVLREEASIRLPNRVSSLCPPSHRKPNRYLFHPTAIRIHSDGSGVRSGRGDRGEHQHNILSAQRDQGVAAEWHGPEVGGQLAGVQANLHRARLPHLELLPRMRLQHGPLLHQLGHHEHGIRKPQETNAPAAADPADLGVKLEYT